MIAPRSISPRALFGAAIVFGLTGIALRTRPPLPPAVASSARAAPELVQGRHAGIVREDSNAYAPIAAANVFSPTRTPPAVRFTPDRTPDRAAPVPVARRARVVEEPAVHLYGITIAPSGALALLATNPSARGAQIYRVGDRVAGGSLAAITDSTVVIARARGRLVLRLPSAKKKLP